MQWITLINPEIVKEVTTEYLFILDIVVSGFIIAYLLREARANNSILSIRQNWGPRLALAFGVYFIGQAVSRLWSTLMYWLRFKGEDPGPVEQRYEIAIIGLVIAAVGLACAIRVLSPRSLGNWGWIGAFVLGATFVAYMQFSVFKN